MLDDWKGEHLIRTPGTTRSEVIYDSPEAKRLRATQEAQRLKTRRAEVKRLHAKGLTSSQIGQKVGHDAGLVYKDIKALGLTVNNPRKRTRKEG